MKKGLFLAALLIATLVITNAYAYPVKFETVDYFAWGTLYNPATGVAQNVNPYTGVPTHNLNIGSYTPQDGTEDAFGITQIQRITSPDGLSIYWQKSAGEELTAFFYGADDVYLGAPNALGKSDLLSNGFTIELWLDNTPDYNPNLGVGGRTGVNTYTNATDGTLVLKLQGHVQYLDYAAGTNLQPFTLEENGFASTGTFGGSILLDVVGGAWASVYNTDTVDAPLSDTNADFSFVFGVHPNTAQVGDWLLADTSNAYGDAVPEPATMSLLGMGLLGLAGLARRKKA